MHTLNGGVRGGGFGDVAGGGTAITRQMACRNPRVRVSESIVLRDTSGSYRLDRKARGGALEFVGCGSTCEGGAGRHRGLRQGRGIE